MDDNRMQEKLRFFQGKMKRPKSFIVMQIIISILLAGPIIAIFSVIFLPLFLSWYNIHLDIDTSTLFLVAIIIQGVIFLFILIYFCIGLILLIIITLTSFRRTNYSGYLYETLIETQILVAPVIGVLLVALEMYFNQTSFSFIFVIGYFLLVTVEYKLIKKPLIWGASYFYWPLSTDIINQDSSDIIMKQALFINDFDDGYSQRPVFESLKDIFSENKTKKEIQLLLEKFARFMALNGDLIGYDSNEHKIIYYLRSTFIQKTQIFNIFVLYKKFKQILKKQNLTCITVDLDTMEANFKLNREDYNVLGEITYHKLNARVLSQFKVAVNEYDHQNYLQSYESLNPQFTNRKSFILQNKLITFLIIGYIAGIFIVGPVLLFLNSMENTITSSSFGFDLEYEFLLWPLAMWLYIETIGNKYQGNYLELFSKEYSNLFLLIFSGIIALLISIVIFYFLYNYKNRTLNIHKIKLKVMK